MKTVKIGPAGADVRLSSGVSMRFRPNTTCRVTEAVLAAMRDQNCDVTVPRKPAKPEKQGKD